MRELEIHEVFTVLDKDSHVFAGVFDSRKYPFTPAAPVRCNYFSSLMILKGEGFLVLDHFEYEVKPGRIFIFSERQLIGWGNYENTIGLVLAFTAPVAMELGIHFNRPYIDLEKEDINLYKGIYENLIREFSKSDAKSEAIIHSGIGYLYALFGRYENVPDVNDKVITALRNIVCRDFSAVITTRQLAGLLKLSHKGLNERCVQKIGLSVKQFVLELRMTEAKRLLAFSPLTNSEIAYASGFDDPSYFARIFRKKVGYSPTIFRKKYRKEA